MSANFKIVLAHKPNADGLYDVRLRITVARKSVYVGLNISVAAKHWNASASLEKENWVKTGDRLASQHNSDLLIALLDAKRVARAVPNASAQELKVAFLRRHEPEVLTTRPDFVAFLQQSVEEVDKPNFTQGTYELRLAVVNKFATWRAGKPLPFNELTEEIIAGFDGYMQRELGNGPTTRRKNLKVLGLYIGRAMRAKLLSRDEDPLEEYTMPKATPKRRWLSEEELQAYEQVALTPMQHVARLTYLTCFYLHGSRIGAVLRLRWRDRQFGRVVFDMDKGGIEKSVPESVQLTAILDSLQPEHPMPDAYIFPWLANNYDQLDAKAQLQCIKLATAKVNKNIWLGAIKAGITKRFSTHSSRRTMATKADRANAGDLGKVGGILGHKQRSTTEIYLDHYNSVEVDQAANVVYESRPLPLLKAG